MSTPLSHAEHGHDHAAHGHDHAGHGHEHADHGHEHADHGHNHAEHGHDQAAGGRGNGHGHGHGHAAGDHGHAHGGVDATILRSRDAMRTLFLSLVILGVTAAFQVVIVVLSDSVALLADSVHNVGDALTAVPLAIAFLLVRRPRTKRLTYGWGRAEDFGGLVVILIILFSAVYAAYESIDRLINPETPGYLLATAAAGIIGFIGNEWVAVYRIRSGKRIGSAALIADGYHARVDGFTSLAVVLGVVGVALGFERADPIIGLLISLVIFRIVWQSIKAIGLRAMDGVEEHTIDAIRRTAGAVAGVHEVVDQRARWLGHTVQAELTVAVAPDLTIKGSAKISDDLRHALVEGVEHVNDVVVQIVPDGAAATPSRPGATAPSL
jgi:cation diffusion facilitator family transporter